VFKYSLGEKRVEDGKGVWEKEEVREWSSKGCDHWRSMTQNRKKRCTP
jgi:hypothetical protein